MGRDVVGLLREIAISQGGMPEAEAAAFVEMLTKQQRLVQELWS